MASDFFPAAQYIQNPDILASYIRGQMAPLQIQQAQQQVAAGGLDIDKLRLALQQQQNMQSVNEQVLRQSGYLGGRASVDQNTGGPTG